MYMYMYMYMYMSHLSFKNMYIMCVYHYVCISAVQNTHLWHHWFLYAFPRFLLTPHTLPRWGESKGSTTRRPSPRTRNRNWPPTPQQTPRLPPTWQQTPRLPPTPQQTPRQTVWIPRPPRLLRSATTQESGPASMKVRAALVMPGERE